MKICFVCNEYPPGPHGGIGTFVQILARALVQAGHEVRAVGMVPNQSVAEESCDEGVRVVRFPFPRYRLGWITARYQLYATIAHWCRSGEVEIVEVPDYEGWAAGWTRLTAPVVARLHGSSTYFAAEMKQPIRSTARWLEKRSLKRADFWCSVSRYTAEKTKSLFHLRTGPDAILYNPIEIASPASSVPRSKTAVIFTGTLAEKKGVVPLVRCWSQVLQACPSAKLHIYGKDGRTSAGGSMRQHLESLLNEQEQASVLFHGHQPRAIIMQALREARLAVFPSYAEAFAIAPLEAMACECPTIYSERGSGPELIHHGEDGLLIDPDQPAKIAAAIVQLITDDALAVRLGTAGYELVSNHFSLGTIVAENEAFYRRCIDLFQTHPQKATTTQPTPAIRA